MNKNKKAQEEMVGFVLIMLIVAIIFLVFLGLYLRGASNAEIRESKEAANFLEAVSKITTECGDTPQVYYDATELITSCMVNPSDCSNGQDRCVVLEETLREAVEGNWNFNQNSPTKGYLIQVLQEGVQGERDIIDPPITGGQPFTERFYASAEKPLPGGIILRLIIYS